MKRNNEEEKFKVEFGGAIAFEPKHSWVVLASAFRRFYYWVSEAKAEVSIGLTYKLTAHNNDAKKKRGE